MTIIILSAVAVILIAAAVVFLINYRDQQKHKQHEHTLNTLPIQIPIRHRGR